MYKYPDGYGYGYINTCGHNYSNLNGVGYGNGYRSGDGFYHSFVTGEGKGNGWQLDYAGGGGNGYGSGFGFCDDRPHPEYPLNMFMR